MSLISPPAMSDNIDRCHSSVTRDVYPFRLSCCESILLEKSNMSIASIVGRTVAFGMAGIVLVPAFFSGTDAPSRSPYEVLQGKVGPDVALPMTRAEFGDTYNRLGASQFENANALMGWAALAAAESDQCNRVEVMGVSDDATRDELQWFVHCQNGERFQINQAQAEAARDNYDPAATPEQRLAAEDVPTAEPKSARWKNFNERVAVTACQDLVRSVMLDQGSFDAAWSWDSEKNEETGIVTIQQDFAAQNGYGGTLSSRFHCEVDSNLAGRITTLKIREADGWRNLI